MTELYASTTRHTKTPCLNCGHTLSAASGFGVEPRLKIPNEGDVTACLYCRHVMVYNADLSLRNPTDEEVVEIAGDPELVAMITLLGTHEQEKELEARRRRGESTAGDEEASRQVRRQARRAALTFLKAGVRTRTRSE
jgi:hypothetical protein